MSRAARVIRVDWQSWAATDALTRRLCGARSYLEASSDVLDAADALRAACPAPEREGPSTAEPTLPGLAAWLKRRGAR